MENRVWNGHSRQGAEEMSLSIRVMDYTDPWIKEEAEEAKEEE